MDRVRFKFKPLNDKGQEVGFLGTKGELTDSELTLGKETIPLPAVLQVIRRRNRLVFVLATTDGPVTRSLAVTTGAGARKIKETVDRLCSAHWAEGRRQELQKAGKAHRFRAADCPACHATIDLSDFDPSPQIYCPFCETLSDLESQQASPLTGYRLCDQCGYFSQPRTFTSFYFIFAFVFYFFQSQTTTRCHACMRSEAWSMVLGNFLFVIGLPFALYQLARAYFAGSMRSQFPELDAANHAARHGKLEKAERHYQAILQRVHHAAGIHYNRARAYDKVGDSGACLSAAREALRDCANYQPAAEFVAAISGPGPGTPDEPVQVDENDPSATDFSKLRRFGQ